MRLSKKEIKYLSGAFKNSTTLSLFKNIEAITDGSEQQKLLEKGIIVGNEYNPEALKILNVLSSAKISTRLIIQNPFFIVEKYTYRDGEKLVLAENYNGDLEFSFLEDFSELNLNLSEVFGISKIINTEISDIFTPDEIIILFSIIDTIRIATLKNYAGDNCDIIEISNEEIFNQLNSDFINGLTKVFIKNYNYEIPKKSQISEILESLEKKGAIIKRNGYLLADEYLKFANNFLVIDSICMYETFEILKNKEIAVASKTAILSGLHDILAIYFDGDTVELDIVSAKQLIFNIEEFMTCPSFEKQSEYDIDLKLVESEVQTTKTPKIATKRTDWFCPRCGNNNRGNFCTGCGTPKP